MAHTLIATAVGANGSGTPVGSVDASSLNVQAGDLLVAWAKHEGAATTLAVADTGGGNGFTFDAGDYQSHANGDLHGSWGYVLSATADASFTARLTLGASRPFVSLIVYQFRPESGESFSKEASNKGTGTSTTPASGAISPSFSDGVVLGGYGEYVANNSSSHQINGVAADAVIQTSSSAGNFTAAWYRILSSGFAGGTASCTNTSAAWICNVIAFESAPTASAAVTGTAAATIDEDDVTAGGKTIILTLTNDTFVPASSTPGIQYVGGRTAGFAGTTSAQTVSLGGLAGGDTGDTTPQAGDLVVVGYAIGSTVARTPTIATPGGGAAYTDVAPVQQRADNFDTSLLVAYKFMGGTPDTQVTLSETAGGTGNAADAGRYTIQVWRGVDPSNPMDVAAVVAGAINSSTVNPGQITPSTAGAVVGVVGAAASGTGATFTSSDLGDFLAGSTADTNDISIGAGYVAWGGAGAVDPAAFGNVPAGTTANSWASVTFALRPHTTTPFADAVQDLIDGLVSAQSEANGWNNEVVPTLDSGDVVRTSDTVVTFTLPAVPGYDITAQESITPEIPASILTGGVAITASPAFTIDPVGGGAANFDATGGLDAQSAVISGSGSVGRTSTGALAAQAAALAGAGSVGRTSSGALAAQSSTISGVVVVSRAASGSLAAQSAVLAGQAALSRAVSGALAAQAAAISGDATVTPFEPPEGENFDASGDLAAQAAAVSGAANRDNVATSGLSAQSAAVAGAGSVGRAASGALVAQSATIVGSVRVNRTASGDLIAQAVAVVGSATSSGAPPVEPPPDNPHVNPLLLPRGVEDQDFEAMARVLEIEQELRDVAEFIAEVQAEGNEYVDPADWRSAFDDSDLF